MDLIFLANSPLTLRVTVIIPSPADVRKTAAESGIEALAASIRAHGLLQNLQVRPTDNGKFEAVAGMRRLRALALSR